MDYFGSDLAQVAAHWWADTFDAILNAKFAGTALAAVVLRSDTTHDWRDPTAPASVLVELRHGRGDTDLLVRNVAHKLRFTVRTGRDSADARRFSHLIEPGDFPHGGAVTHRGVIAGVSGLSEESDAWVAQQVIDRLIEMRGEIADLAVAASLRGVPGWAYLPDLPVPPVD